MKITEELLKELGFTLEPGAEHLVKDRQVWGLRPENAGVFQVMLQPDYALVSHNFRPVTQVKVHTLRTLVDFIAIRSVVQGRNNLRYEFACLFDLQMKES